MTDYSKSKTLRNLQNAVVGEFLGYLQYRRNAKQARAEGHEAIAGTFEQLAENELQHALVWGNELLASGTTEENLQAAIDAELQGGDALYPAFAAEAEQEGFHGTANLLRRVGEIESRHATVFRNLLDQLEGLEPAPEKIPLPDRGKRFLLCRHCGALEVAEPGASCSLCKNPDAFR